jgi:hypothetical protein
VNINSDTLINECDIEKLGIATIKKNIYYPHQRHHHRKFHKRPVRITNVLIDHHDSYVRGHDYPNSKGDKKKADEARLNEM